MSLNLSADASLTNGFRYIKGRLMQYRKVYLNKCQEHAENGVNVHTDAFTIQRTQPETARELLSWEEGNGSRSPTRPKSSCSLR